MKIRTRILTGLTTLSFLLSCTERIDLPLDEGSIRLVVEGSVTTESRVHTIYLTESTAYYYNQEPPAVTGATVTISDGVSVFVLVENSPGVYQTGPGFSGTEGTKYTLNIKLLTPVGGFTDFTASSVINRQVILDSAGLKFYEEFGEEGLWEVKCWFGDSLSTDFYRFDLYRNDHLITHKLSKWIVTDDKFFNGEYVNGGVITYLDQNSKNEKLLPGDELTVTLGTISREYFNFIQDAQSELRGSNPLFSGPGANVRGNISNGAIGFFAAYPVSSVKVIVP